MRIKQIFQQYESREALNAYLFLIPVLFITTLFVLIPVFGTFWGSLFRDVTYLPKKFIGIQNFLYILGNADFWRALRFTLVFTVTAVVLETFFGMLFALLLNETFKGRVFLRTVILIPWAIPTIVSAKVWKLIFDYTYGILNFLVVNLGFSGDKINWLGSSFAAFWSLITAEVWKTTPFVVIILLAGLQAIPQDLYQQAKVDGAGIFKRFRTITLILIQPVLIIALIFRTIDSLRIFDLVYVLTGGGPGGSTKPLSMLGFEMYTNDLFGKGSTVSIITFCIVFIITIVYLKAGRFRERLS